MIATLSPSLMKRSHLDAFNEEENAFYQALRPKISLELGAKRSFEPDLELPSEIPAAKIQRHLPNSPTQICLPEANSSPTKLEILSTDLTELLKREQYFLMDLTRPNPEGMQLVLYQPPIIDSARLQEDYEVRSSNDSNSDAMVIEYIEQKQ